MNAEGVEEAGEGVGGEAAVRIPRTGGEGVNPLEEGGGGEAIRVAVVGEAIVDVGQELEVRLEIDGGLQVEDGGESFHGAVQPGASDQGGE
jgi:hypothetical protein